VSNLKGRKVGQTEVTIEEMQTIIDLTKKGSSRKQIANAINRSMNTVWRYQKKLNLL
jgi:DNA-binding NarL/FixJ family response regulator